MKIYGAGMAGLLAANMLRRYEPEVHELQASLPYNHGALLRFRTDAVSKATGQPFKKILVHKAVLWMGQLYYQPTIQMANSYSLKVTGEILPRSIINTEPSYRYIAPPDFIEKMTKGINIVYDSPLRKPFSDDVIISTIPMPALMDITGWDNRPHFPHDAIISVKVNIADPKVDIYQTIYAAHPNVKWYRASISGHVLIVEYLQKDWLNYVAMPEEDRLDYCYDDVRVALEYFGLYSAETDSTETKFQKFGKLRPVDDSVRKSFIYGATQLYGIYSLGRFATWRQILLDDVVHDIEVIDNFIMDKSEYTRHLRSI